MAYSPRLAKEWYKDMKVEELEEMWNGFIKKETNKELFLKTLVDTFMDASYHTNNSSSKEAVRELLKEKTGRDYSIDNSKTYELECSYKMRKNNAKKLSLEIEEKAEEYLVTFKDVFDYVMLECNDFFWVEAFRKFYDKLDFVQEYEKLKLLLILYYDKEDCNNLSKELASSYDIKSLYEKYNKLAENFANKNKTIG